MVNRDRHHLGADDVAVATPLKTHSRDCADTRDSQHRSTHPTRGIDASHRGSSAPRCRHARSTEDSPAERPAACSCRQTPDWYVSGERPGSLTELSPARLGTWSLRTSVKSSTAWCRRSSPQRAMPRSLRLEKWVTPDSPLHSRSCANPRSGRGSQTFSCANERLTCSGSSIWASNSGRPKGSSQVRTFGGSRKRRPTPSTN